MQITKYWKSITTIAGGIITIAGAFVVLGLEMPRPAWASEVKELSGYVLEIDNKITSQQLDDKRLSLYSNLREQRSYEADNLSVPSYLIKERVLLERQIRILQNHLDSIIGEDE